MCAYTFEMSITLHRVLRALMTSRVWCGDARRRKFFKSMWVLIFKSCFLPIARASLDVWESGRLEATFLHLSMWHLTRRTNSTESNQTQISFMFLVKRRRALLFLFPALRLAKNAIEYSQTLYNLFSFPLISLGRPNEKPIVLLLPVYCLKSLN